MRRSSASRGSSPTPRAENPGRLREVPWQPNKSPRRCAPGAYNWSTTRPAVRVSRSGAAQACPGVGACTSLRNHLKSPVVAQVTLTKGATDGAAEEAGGAFADDLAGGRRVVGEGRERAGGVRPAGPLRPRPHRDRKSVV